MHRWPFFFAFIRVHPWSISADCMCSQQMRVIQMKDQFFQKCQWSSLGVFFKETVRLGHWSLCIAICRSWENSCPPRQNDFWQIKNLMMMANDAAVTSFQYCSFDKLSWVVKTVISIPQRENASLTLFLCRHQNAALVKLCSSPFALQEVIFWGQSRNSH